MKFPYYQNSWPSSSIHATPRPTPTPVSHTGNSGIPVYRFEPGTLLASRYRIISRLGKGGMGEVFRADDIMLGQPVALKFLSETAAGNPHREARVVMVAPLAALRFG